MTGRPSHRLLAVRLILGSPGLSTCASFVALGILYQESGFSLGLALLSTATVFALPAQVAHAELYAGGATALAVGFTVLLINSRFLPMIIALFPLLRKPGLREGHLYWLSHFTAVTSWACFMSSRRQVAPADRFDFYVTLALGVWVMTILATLAGHLVAGALSERAITTMLIINPTYFVCMILSATSRRPYLVAMALGVLAYLATRDAAGGMALTVSGVVGGTAAFVLARLWEDPGWKDTDG